MKEPSPAPTPLPAITAVSPSAAGEALDFMVLNRRYEVGSDNTIKDLTTYIDPQKYIEIFADTSIDSQNFWVQTVVQATRRGNYSAKQIPFL